MSTAEQHLSANALAIVERRYLRKDETGKNVETVEGMFFRVARHVASAHAEVGTPTHDALTKSYMNVMSTLKFLPNTPTFTGAGTPLGQLAACFVLPIDDDIGKDSKAGIFETLSKAARIQQSGGGVGFSFSRLRPKGDRVQKSAGIASGPVSFIRVYGAALGAISVPRKEQQYDVYDHCIGAEPVDFEIASGPIEFMKVYNTAFEAIAQGGTRRGASMGVLRVDHPDILEFIRCKGANESILTGFNISVGVTDKFMQAVKDNETIQLINPRTNQPWTSPEGVSELSANAIMDEIAKYAHKNGEPGILFLDELNRSNPVPHLYKIETTNPCGASPSLSITAITNFLIGEQALGPYESCNLGSINLAKHLIWKDNECFAKIDYDSLAETIHLAVRFLDDVITANTYVPSVPELREAAWKARRIGLGYMGLADVLMAIGVRYGARDGIAATRQITAFMQFHAMKASIELAEERGPFPAIEGSMYDQRDIKWKAPDFIGFGIDWNQIYEGIKKFGIRNAATTTIAPTGTIATVAAVEGYGLEPAFALSYSRNVRKEDGTTLRLRYASKLFARALQFAGISQDDPAVEKALDIGSCQHIEGIPDWIQEVFVTAGDIRADEHIKMQAAVQQFLSNSVSKTINFPAGTTVRDIRDAYMMAWQLRCRGLTVYVTNSRETVVLEAGGKK